MKLIKINKCLVCSSKKITVLFRKNGFTFDKCNDCSFVFVNPRPSEKDLMPFYNENFFKGKVKFPERWAKNYCEGVTSYIGRSKKTLKKIGHYKKSGKLLDIGCGLGYLIEQAGKEGWEAMGLEISDYAVKVCLDKKLEVLKGQVEKLGSFSSSFDVIVAQDVLEHVFSPENFLNRINKLLKNNGLLVLELPNNSSLRAKLFGKAWIEYIPPVHLNFFDKSTLNRILWNHGFEVKKIYSEISITLGLREKIRKLARNQPHSIFEILNSFDVLVTNFKRNFFYPPLNFFAERFDIHGDLLIVFAIKRQSLR